MAAEAKKDETKETPTRRESRTEELQREQAELAKKKEAAVAGPFSDEKKEAIRARFPGLEDGDVSGSRDDVAKKIAKRLDRKGLTDAQVGWELDKVT